MSPSSSASIPPHGNPPPSAIIPPPTIVVRNLSYSFPDTSAGLHDITLLLPARSRTLLIGANGSGKTTLLRLLAGKRLAPCGSISVAGCDPFSTSLEGVTYLGLEWVLNPVVRSDIGVPELLASVGGTYYPARRDELVEILDIDVAWRLHVVSDGERRRVQLAMGLLRPWRVLLLDEVTVDLDLLSRRRFLNWLKEETQRRDCSVVYATHILDGLQEWGSHVVHMHLGGVKGWGRMEEVVGDGGGEEGGLAEVALNWLREDFEERGPRGGRAGEGKTYESLEGRGGYGFEKRG